MNHGKKEESREWEARSLYVKGIGHCVICASPTLLVRLNVVGAQYLHAEQTIKLILTPQGFLWCSGLFPSFYRGWNWSHIMTTYLIVVHSQDYNSGFLSASRELFLQLKEQIAFIEHLLCTSHFTYMMSYLQEKPAKDTLSPYFSWGRWSSKNLNVLFKAECGKQES